jgi:hypothetical protein
MRILHCMHIYLFRFMSKNENTKNNSVAIPRKTGPSSRSNIIVKSLVFSFFIMLSFFFRITKITKTFKYPKKTSSKIFFYQLTLDFKPSVSILFFKSKLQSILIIFRLFFLQFKINQHHTSFFYVISVSYIL